MKALKTILIGAICVWLGWNLFAAVFLTHSSGGRGYGGFPVADRDRLYDFLSSSGFTRVPFAGGVDTAQTQESFRGSFHGSRPFTVTVSTKTTNDFGMYVETAYEFKGFRWSVDDSFKKAQEFSENLDRWLAERRMRRLDARL